MSRASLPPCFELDRSKALTVLVQWNIGELVDLMTTALEGAIGYWAETRNVRRDVDLSVLSFEVRSEVTIAPEEAKWTTIDAYAMSKALALVLSGDVKVGRPIVGQIVTQRGASDAECADVLVQVAAFGEIVFG